MGALPFRGTTRAHALAVLALLAAMVFRFHRLVFEGLVRLEDEMADEYYPLADSVFTQIRHGSFPTWSPEILCGYPASLVPDLHVFSPFSLPFLLAPPHLAVAVQVFLALLLAGLFLYALARRLEMSTPAAALAAILWTSGLVSDSLQSVSMPLATVPWIPLVILSWDRFASSRDARWAVAAGGAMGLLVLGGQAQLAYWTAAYLVGFHLLLSQRSRDAPLPDGRVVRGALLAVVVAALMSAVLVLPTRQVLADSIRASLEPGERVPASVLSLRETGRALGSTVFTTGGTLEGDADLRYAGPLAVALALLAWGRGRRLDNSLLILAAVFLTLSLGAFFAPANWVLRHVPLNEFRYPARIGLFSTLSLVLLAGRGFDRLVTGEARCLPNLLCFAALALGSAPRIRDLLRSSDPLEASEGRLALACLLLVAFCLALPAGDGIRRILRRLALTGAACACVVHARVMTDLPSTWVTVRAWGRDAGAWGHLDAPLEPYPPEHLWAIPRSDAHGPVRWLQLDSAWKHDLSLLTGQQTPLGLVSLRPERVDRLVYARRVASDDEAPLDRTLLAHPALLDVLNVQYLAMDPARFEDRFGRDGSGGRFVARRRVGRFVLVENRSYLPRAFFLDKAEWVRGEEAARERISAEGFDPRRLLVLEGAVEPLPADAGDPLLLPATVTRYESERVEISAAAPREGFVVLLDRWAPGWSARLDGRSVPVLRADYLFRAVRVTAGRHLLVFEYDNALFRWGLVLSAAGLLSVLAAAGSLLRSRRR